MKTPIELRSWIFFYGAYMRVSTLRDVGLIPEEYRIARLNGFRLEIAPYPNVRRDLESSVWGVVASVNHEDMRKLHTGNPTVFYGCNYYPFAVLVYDKQDNIIPALCYTCHEMAQRRPEISYVEGIAATAEEYGLPAPYVAMIRRLAT